jgi:hypothetical protein
MSLSISYGDFDFPTPLPFVGLDESPIYISGQMDHSLISIDLVGEITGCNLGDLKIAKNSLIDGLSSGFKTLTVGSASYPFAKPVSISFSDSNLVKSIPYSIQFEAFEEKDFSQFYGIENPVDFWEYSEQDGRRVSAVHTVGARGVKASATESLEVAKSFVEGRIGDFQNLSIFFSGDNVIKTDSSQSIDRALNTYSVSESFSLSQSLNSDISGVIVRPSCQISYDKDSFSASVDGFIEGGLTGVVVDTGYFSPSDATEFLKNSLTRFKTEYEEDLYGEILRSPESFNYNVDTGSNKISFNFSFNDPTDFRTGDVIHDFSTDFNASKDDGFINASINGEIKYNSTNDVFTGQAPESEVRFQKVQEYFSGVDEFSILQNHFSYFTAINGPYYDGPLDPNFIKKTVNKSPHLSSIDYAAAFSNKKDLFSGIFKNASISVDTQHPIPNFKIKETIDNSFSVQEVYDTLKRTSVSFNGILNDGFTTDEAVSYLNSFVSQYSGQNSLVSSDTLQTGSNRISFSKSFVIENE